MASPTDSQRSSPVPEPLDLVAGLSTIPADVAAQRRLPRQPVPGLLERIDDLSAVRLGRVREQRRAGSAGRAPFTL
ncbi:MAG: hypothetical protein AMXMBFR36_00490 [Acidobacteriota bacterium]